MRGFIVKIILFLVAASAMGSVPSIGQKKVFVPSPEAVEALAKIKVYSQSIRLNAHLNSQAQSKLEKQPNEFSLKQKNALEQKIALGEGGMTKSYRMLKGAVQDLNQSIPAGILAKEVSAIVQKAMESSDLTMKFLDGTYDITTLSTTLIDLTMDDGKKLFQEAQEGARRKRKQMKTERENAQKQAHAAQEAREMAQAQEQQKLLMQQRAVHNFRAREARQDVMRYSWNKANAQVQGQEAVAQQMQVKAMQIAQEQATQQAAERARIEKEKAVQKVVNQAMIAQERVVRPESMDVMIAQNAAKQATINACYDLQAEARALRVIGEGEDKSLSSSDIRHRHDFIANAIQAKSVLGLDDDEVESFKVYVGGMTKDVQDYYRNMATKGYPQDELAKQHNRLTFATAQALDALDSIAYERWCELTGNKRNDYEVSDDKKDG